MFFLMNMVGHWFADTRMDTLYQSLALATQKRLDHDVPKQMLLA
jgi:hypothetical protein